MDIIQRNGSFALLNSDTDSDSNSDCKPNSYIVLCRTFHTTHRQIQIPILIANCRNGFEVGIGIRNQICEWKYVIRLVHLVTLYVFILTGAEIYEWRHPHREAREGFGWLHHPASPQPRDTPRRNPRAVGQSDVAQQKRRQRWEGVAADGLRSQLCSTVQYSSYILAQVNIITIFSCSIRQFCYYSVSCFFICHC